MITYIVDIDSFGWQSQFWVDGLHLDDTVTTFDDVKSALEWARSECKELVEEYKQDCELKKWSTKRSVFETIQLYRYRK